MTLLMLLLSLLLLFAAGSDARASTFEYHAAVRDRTVPPSEPSPGHWVHSLPCGPDRASQARLVITSHVAYSRPLDQLLHSLVAVGFRDFCRVLIVLGGSDKDSAPERMGAVVVAHTRINAHDMTAYTVLQKHQTSGHVRAASYLYIHDTCLASPQLVRFLEWMEQHYSESGSAYDVFACPAPAANIAAFGAGILSRLDSRFVGRDLTKREALEMEMGNSGPQQLGNLTLLAGAGWGIEMDLVTPQTPFDVYGTGVPRHMRYFPDFGVYKFVLINRHGDMDGVLVGN